MTLYGHPIVNDSIRSQSYGGLALPKLALQLAQGFYSCRNRVHAAQLGHDHKLHTPMDHQWPPTLLKQHRGQERDQTGEETRLRLGRGGFWGNSTANVLSPSQSQSSFLSSLGCAPAKLMVQVQVDPAGHKGIQKLPYSEETSWANVPWQDAGCSPVAWLHPRMVVW